MNATAAARTTLTRADSPKGQYVTVNFRNGSRGLEVVTGTLMAWGPQIFRIYVTGHGPGRTREIPTAVIGTVTEAVR